METFDKNEAINKLMERKATLPCHRCGSTKFGVLDGITTMHIIENMKMLNSIIVGGPVIPVLNVACENCGAITSHSLGVLDMLPKDASNG